MKSLFPQETTTSNIYITPKKIVGTGAIISELHYYGHIYMTCLLFFKEKIQDNYSYFEITLKFNKIIKVLLLFIYFVIFIFFIKQTYIFVKKKRYSSA